MVQPDTHPTVARHQHFRFDPGLLAALVIAPARSSVARPLLLATVIFASIFMRELLRVLCGVIGGRCETGAPVTQSSDTRGVDVRRLRAHLVVRHLAGPVTSLLIAAVLRCAFPAPAPAWVANAVGLNAAWGLVGLLPGLPFPGGRVLRACLGPDGDVAAMLVSVGVAEVACALAIAGLRSPWLGLIFLVAGVSTALQWLRTRRRVLNSEALEQLQQARALHDARRYGDACRAAEAVVHTACTSDTRNAALTLLARVAIHAGQPGKAAAAVRSIAPRSAVDAWTLAAVENANGHPERAIATLDRVRRREGLDQAGARLLIDLHASVGDYPSVTGVAIDLLRLLGPEDIDLVAGALHAARESELAARLVSASAPATAMGREGASTRGRRSVPEPERRAPSSS
jgi:Zn-dependent protease